MVDGGPVCARCGRHVRPVGNSGWEHVPGGGDPADWLPHIDLADLHPATGYAEMSQRYPALVRVDVMADAAIGEADWEAAVPRLLAYRDRLGTLDPGAGGNPLLDLFVILTGEEDGERRGFHGAPSGLLQALDVKRRRRELAARLAWAVPTSDAVAAMVSLGPVADCGAGTGYWVAQITAAGGNAVATDLAPPGDDAGHTYHPGPVQTWAPVSPMAAVEAVKSHPDRVPLLCWPPYGDDDASYAVLRACRSPLLVHVGDANQATGSVRFHRELSLNWSPVDVVPLPPWPGIGDRLTVYRRNPQRRRHTVRDRCHQCGAFLPTGAVGRCPRCREQRPAALTLSAGEHRMELTEKMLAGMHPALRAALERSSNRVL